MISIKKYAVGCVLGLSALALLSSCNNDLEQIAGPGPVIPTGLTIAETLNTTPTDSLFNKIVKKNAALVTLLTSKTNSFTLFVPDNAAMIASLGGTLAAANNAITNMSATTAAGIVNYNLVPQKLPTTGIVHPFPNMQVPTSIILDPTNSFVRMTSFPSRNPANGSYYYNTAPLVATDLVVANGLIHHTAFLVTPPSLVLAQIIYADPTLTYFTAAIARGDSGQTGLNKFDSLLKYPVVNMTVLTPNDAAMKALLDTTIRRALIAQGVPPATAAAQATALSSTTGVFTNPLLYGALTATVVRGILAYHFLSSGKVPVTPDIRVFTVNVPPTPIFIKTLVNGSVSIHPGVMASATYAGPIVTAMTFAGLGTNPTGGTPFSQPANAIVRDRLAINGITHTLDKVLLPQ
ncbi:MAG TPA: fasciclin domain-containing protein [Ferruginibacter sp.]|nr:fasciclin domain-containing protein [Ferruginibacter sp.]